MCLHYCGYESGVSYSCVLRRLNSNRVECSERDRDAEGSLETMWQRGFYHSLTDQQIEGDQRRTDGTKIAELRGKGEETG